MSRYKADPIIVGPDWDPDESATLKGSYSYLELETVLYRLSEFGALNRPENASALVENARALARVLLELYRIIVLRRRDTPYQEGVDRPRTEFTEDGLIGERFEDLLWLLREGSAHIAPLLPKADDAAPITDAAAEVGMTPATFPAGDSG